jgi:hypothetical protein
MLFIPRKISIFALLMLAGWAVPSVAFGAAPMLRGSGTVMSAHGGPAASRGFHGPLFFGADGFGGTEVTIQQSQSAPATPTHTADSNRVYVPPQWVDGGFGVQVSVPGHWSAAAGR